MTHDDVNSAGDVFCLFFLNTLELILVPGFKNTKFAKLEGLGATPTGSREKKGADSMSSTKRQSSSGTRGGLKEPGRAHGK